MRLIFLVLVFLLTAFTSEAKTVIFHFQILHPQTDQISLTYQKYDQAYPSTFKGILKNGGVVSLGLEFDQAKLVLLEHAGKTIEIYAGGADQLEITFEGNAMAETITFKGAEAGLNDFLKEHQNQYGTGATTFVEFPFVTAKVSSVFYEKAKTNSAAVYYDSLLSFYKNKKTHLVEHMKKGQVPIALTKHLERRMTYELEGLKRLYPIVNKDLYDKSTLERLNRDQELDQFRLEDKALLEPIYLDYLKLLVHYLYLPNSQNNPKLEYDLYDIIINNITGRSKYYALKELMKKVYLEKTESNLAKDKYAVFHADNPYPEYNEEIIQLYGQQFQLETVEVAPDFEVKDENGKRISLSDFKGKVVYLSFWASWCKPCLKGFQNSIDLRKQIQGVGVVLLNVSLDEKDVVWKGTLNRQEIVGINTKAISKEQMQLLYDVGALPAYFIVDKTGKFTYLSDDPNRNIIDEFKAMVQR